MTIPEHVKPQVQLRVLVWPQTLDHLTGVEHLLDCRRYYAHV